MCKFDWDWSSATFKKLLCVCQIVFPKQWVYICFIENKQLNICLAWCDFSIKIALVLTQRERDENVTQVLGNRGFAWRTRSIKDDASAGWILVFLQKFLDASSENSIIDWVLVTHKPSQTLNSHFCNINLMLLKIASQCVYHLIQLWKLLLSDSFVRLFYCLKSCFVVADESCHWNASAFCQGVILIIAADLLIYQLREKVFLQLLSVFKFGHFIKVEILFSLIFFFFDPFGKCF